MSYLVLVCAVLAALATGVLAAQVVCQSMFGLFRMHARQIALKAAPPALPAARVSEG